MKSVITPAWIFGDASSRHRGVTVKVEGDKLLTVAEALVQGGLDWDVEARKCKSDDADEIPATGYRQVVRVNTDKDTGEKTFLTLGMVKGRYRLLPQTKAFSFFDTVTFDGAATVKAVGHNDYGRVVWAVAERPQSVELFPGVEVREHLILYTSHDGASAVRVMFAPHRVDTGTMVGVGFGRKFKSEVRIRHTKSMDERLKTAHNALVADTAYWDRWRAALVGGDDGTYTDPRGNKKLALSRKLVTPDQVQSVVSALFPSKTKKHEDGSETDEVSTRAANCREKIEEHYQEQVDVARDAYQKAGKAAPAGPTALDLYLGVTEYLAQDRTTRNEGNHWVASTFGTGADMRQKAFDLIAGM